MGSNTSSTNKVFFKAGDSFLIYLDSYNFVEGSSITGKVAFKVHNLIPQVSIIMGLEGTESVMWKKVAAYTVKVKEAHYKGSGNARTKFYKDVDK